MTQYALTPVDGDPFASDAGVDYSDPVTASNAAAARDAAQHAYAVNALRANPSVNGLSAYQSAAVSAMPSDWATLRGGENLAQAAGDPTRPMYQRIGSAIGAEGYNLGAGILSSAYGAATLPGDVATGRVDPSSPEAIRRSTDLAGMLTMPAGGGVASDPNTLGVFGEGNTFNANLKTLKNEKAIDAIEPFNIAPFVNGSVATPRWPDLQVAHVDVGKVDDMWKKTPDYRIEPADLGENFKLDRAKEFIGKLGPGDTFEPPVLGINKGSDGNFDMGFDDGRHRFAAMRDMGMKTAPVSMDAESMVNARDAGLLAAPTALSNAVDPNPVGIALTPVPYDPFAKTK